MRGCTPTSCAPGSGARRCPAVPRDGRAALRPLPNDPDKLAERLTALERLPGAAGRAAAGRGSVRAAHGSGARPGGVRGRASRAATRRDARARRAERAAAAAGVRVVAAGRSARAVQSARRHRRRVPAGGEPLRIELWGDEIDTLRLFDPATQRSTEQLETASDRPRPRGVAPAGWHQPRPRPGSGRSSPTATPATFSCCGRVVSRFRRSSCTAGSGAPPPCWNICPARRAGRGRTRRRRTHRRGLRHPGRAAPRRCSTAARSRPDWRDPTVPWPRSCAADAPRVDVSSIRTPQLPIEHAAKYGGRIEPFLDHAAARTGRTVVVQSTGEPPEGAPRRAGSDGRPARDARPARPDRPSPLSTGLLREGWVSEDARRPGVHGQ